MKRPCRPPSELHAQRVARSCERYERAICGGFSLPRADGDVRAQAARFRAGCEAARTMEAAVRQVLCARGIQPAHFVEYHNFARHVARLRREFSGRELSLRAAAAVDHWLGQGVSSDVLFHICLNVFDLDLRHGLEPAPSPAPGDGV
ncbi:hypothetical protein FJY71_01600 [candidate division WOR-3 bacterium]|nr:hypothetical protein [candidate division WOR-3 bacterium]